MLRRGWPLLMGVLVGVFLAACSAGVNGSEGDCNARIRFGGEVYEPRGDLDQDAPAGKEIGDGEVIDCGDGSSAPVVDRVAVHAVRGVPTSVAIRVLGEDWSGAYVAEDLPRAEWPDALK